MSTVLVRPQVSVAELVEALRAQQHHRPAVQGSVGELPTRNVALHERARTLLVVGAHPGAGATVVSVAMADAIATLQAEPSAEEVVLLDAAAREVSGMAAASACEVGGHSDGWRRGRRGSITVLRPAASPAAPLDLPGLPRPGPGWLVVDGGWPWREVVADPNPIQTLVGCAQLVVVCRASVPGVGHAESALSALPGGPLVAAVGARRWPPAARASFGPRLAHAVSEGRALLIPSDPRVVVNGVDSEAFPGGIAAAAQRLVALLEPPVSGSTVHPRRKGIRR